MNPAPIENPSRADALLKEGWTRQFLASSPRLEEASELYKSMGFEVHLEPARAEDLACSECHVEGSPTIGDWYVIYTRPGRGAGGTDKEGLW